MNSVNKTGLRSIKTRVLDQKSVRTSDLPEGRTKGGVEEECFAPHFGLFFCANGPTMAMKALGTDTGGQKISYTNANLGDSYPDYTGNGNLQQTKGGRSSLKRDPQTSKDKRNLAQCRNAKEKRHRMNKYKRRRCANVTWPWPRATLEKRWPRVHATSH